MFYEFELCHNAMTANKKNICYVKSESAVDDKIKVLRCRAMELEYSGALKVV